MNKNRAFDSDMSITSINYKTGMSFLYHQPWPDWQFKVMFQSMNSGVRQTWISSGSRIYKLHALEQASPPYNTFVSPSVKYSNSDTYLIGCYEY